MMKKMFVLILVTIMSQFVFAQEKQDTSLNKTRFGMADKRHSRGDRHAKRAMMKELNLTEAQKEQLKEMKKADKEKRAAILNDSKLTEEQKQGQLKDLHLANAKNMQAILTDEQKAKMKAARENMKAERKNNDSGKRHHRKMKDPETTETQSAKQ